MVQTEEVELQEGTLTTTPISDTEVTTVDAKTGEATTKETIQMSAEDMGKAVREYLNMPDVRKNLLTWAEKINERTRGNWFDFEFLMKKTPLKNAENAKAILDFLIMSGLCHRVVKEKGVIKFKITLKKQDKIGLLKIQAEELALQREAILREIEVLSAEVAA